MRFFSIEGGVCSGKSTLCQNMQTTHGFLTIKEYMSHFLGKIDYPLSRLDTIELFLKIEEKRLNTSDSGNIIITDRSLLSILAFEYALKRMGRIAHVKLPSRIDNFDLPVKTFFLDVNHSLRSQRWVQRGESVNSIFNNVDFNTYNREFFVHASKFIDIEIVKADSIGTGDLSLYIFDIIGGMAVSKNTGSPISICSLMDNVLKVSS